MKHSNSIKTLLITGLSVASFVGLSSPAFAQDTVSFEVMNFIGRMTIVNGDEVSIKGADAGTLSEQGTVWRVDGGEEIKVTSCRENNSRVELSFGSWSFLGRNGGYKNLDEYPHLKVTLPDTARLTISDSVIYGDAKDLGAADITLNHCGDLVLGSIAQTLELEIKGSADLEADDVGTANIFIRGSGDVSLDEVGDFSLSINGSGDVDVSSINGAATLNTNGSGDIEIDDIDGSLEYRNQGSGDLSIDDLRASTAYISINGSGDVEIDSGGVDDISITTNGSGDVSFGGQAGDVKVRSSGSSDVFVKDASGDVRARVNGSGSVKVDGTRYKRN